MDLGFLFVCLGSEVVVDAAQQYVWPLLYACTKQLLYGYAFPVLYTLCTDIHWISLVVYVYKLLLGASRLA